MAEFSTCSRVVETIITIIFCIAVTTSNSPFWKGKNMKYAYPVAISYEPDGNPKSNDYLVYIPDFTKGPATEGKDLVDGLEMAEDWLSLMMDALEKGKKSFPNASDIQEVQKQFPNATTSLVVVDLEKLRK